MQEADDVMDATSSALERTCALQSKLRGAVQDLHPLTTSLDVDIESAEKERDALLQLTEQLELLEDRLREYRSLDPYDNDLKAITLRHMESSRRELVQASVRNLPNVVFSKEVLKEIIAFADTSGGEEAAAAAAEERKEGGLGGRRAGKAPMAAPEDDEAGFGDDRRYSDTIPAYYPPSASAATHAAPRANGGLGSSLASGSGAMQQQRYNDPVMVSGSYPPPSSSVEVAPPAPSASSPTPPLRHTSHAFGVASRAAAEPARPPRASSAAPRPFRSSAAAGGGGGGFGATPGSPTRSEVEEADRIIAKYGEPRELPGGPKNWMGTLMPVRDEYASLNGSGGYHLDADYGGKLRVSSAATSSASGDGPPLAPPLVGPEEDIGPLDGRGGGAGGMVGTSGGGRLRSSGRGGAADVSTYSDMPRGMYRSIDPDPVSASIHMRDSAASGAAGTVNPSRFSSTAAAGSGGVAARPSAAPVSSSSLLGRGYGEIARQLDPPPKPLAPPGVLRRAAGAVGGVAADVAAGVGDLAGDVAAGVSGVAAGVGNGVGAVASGVGSLALEAADMASKLAVLAAKGALLAGLVVGIAALARKEVRARQRARARSRESGGQQLLLRGALPFSSPPGQDRKWAAAAASAPSRAVHAAAAAVAAATSGSRAERAVARQQQQPPAELMSRRGSNRQREQRQGSGGGPIGKLLGLFPSFGKKRQQQQGGGVPFAVPVPSPTQQAPPPAYAWPLPGLDAMGRPRGWGPPDGRAPEPAGLRSGGAGQQRMLVGTGGTPSAAGPAPGPRYPQYPPPDIRMGRG